MSRFRAFSQPLILLVLIALIVTPAWIMGGQMIQQAGAIAGKNPLEAAALYARAARLLPWRTDLLQQAGMQAYYAEDYAAAVSYFSSAQKQYHLSSKAWDAYGVAHWQSGNLDAAAETWQQGLNANGPDARLYNHLATYYYYRDDLAMEQDTLQAMLAVDPENADGQYRFGLLLTVSEPERALEPLLAASRLDDKYAPVVDTLRGALNLAPIQGNPSQARILVGNALGLANEWKLALIVFDQAVQADPENAEAWAWLGLGKQANGQDGSGEVETAISLAPRSPVVHAQRGLYFEHSDDWVQAEASYLEAARLDPSDPAWQAALGQVYVQLGDIPVALAYYKKATELAPKDSEYWRLLAGFCAQNKVYLLEEGLPAAVKARDLAPNDPAALDAVGWVFLGIGNLEMAQTYFDRALEADPNFAQATLHKALAYLEQGDGEQAYYALQKAALDTGQVGKDARRILSQVFP